MALSDHRIYSGLYSRDADNGLGDHVGCMGVRWGDAGKVQLL